MLASLLRRWYQLPYRSRVASDAPVMGSEEHQTTHTTGARAKLEVAHRGERHGSQKGGGLLVENGVQAHAGVRPREGTEQMATWLMPQNPRAWTAAVEGEAG
jgi:hypothetical protein